METTEKKPDGLIYKTYTIQEDFRNPYRKEPEYMFYPTEQGIDHDADYDGESFKYCGNCKWTDSIDEAKDSIDEIIMEAKPLHKVRMNGRVYPFDWIIDAVRFCDLFNGEMLTPIYSI
jgi:hypothetical protein